MTTFVHQELHTTHPEAAKEFYASVFGWTYEDAPMPDGMYAMIRAKNGTIGGITATQNGTPAMWLGYVQVDSIDRTSDLVTEAGGSVLLPKQPIPGMGYLAWYRDPQGVTFAVWEPASGQPASSVTSAAPSRRAPRAKKASSKKASSKKASSKKASSKKASSKKASSKPAPVTAAPKVTQVAAAKKAAKKKSAKAAAPKAARGAAKKAPGARATATKAEAPAAKKTARKGR